MAGLNVGVMDARECKFELFEDPTRPSLVDIAGPRLVNRDARLLDIETSGRFPERRGVYAIASQDGFDLAGRIDRSVGFRKAYAATGIEDFVHGPERGVGVMRESED